MAATATKTTEGFVEFKVYGVSKPCLTWYKAIGESSSGKTPLVIVHGGPGLTHHYLLPMIDFYDKWEIPLIFYDQLGNGLSTHLPEKAGDESFWTEALFHDELSNLVSQLGLSYYDLLGHSWGGMMGSTFAGKRPKGLRRLVLSNVTATGEAWDTAYNEYRLQQSQESQDAMKRCEESGTTDSAKYAELMRDFNREHFCNIDPLPDYLRASLEWRTKDRTVSLTMHGPDRWEVTGSLAGWTSVPVLQNITAPTLVLNGVNEGATDLSVAPFLEMISNVTWIKLQRSTHMPHLEERENYINVVGTWLVQS